MIIIIWSIFRATLDLSELPEKTASEKNFPSKQKKHIASAKIFYIYSKQLQALGKDLKILSPEAFPICI